MTPESHRTWKMTNVLGRMRQVGIATSRSTEVCLSISSTNCPCMASATLGTFAKAQFAAGVASETGECKYVCMRYNIVSTDGHRLNPTPVRTGKPWCATSGLRDACSSDSDSTAVRPASAGAPTPDQCFSLASVPTWDPPQAPQEHQGGSGPVSGPLDRPDLDPSHWRKRKGSRTSFNVRPCRILANSRRG